MSYYASLAKIASAEAALGAPIALEDSLVLKQLVVALGNVTGGGGGGAGTVTSFSFTDGAGITGVVTNPTTTPALALTLGAITPTSVNGLTFAAAAVGFTIAGGTTSKTLTVLDTGTAALLGIAQTFTAAKTFTLGTNSITPVNALLLQNTTAAISGTQSASPSIILSGQGFKTAVGSQDTAWRIYNLPVQGAALDTGLMFGWSVNGGAYTDQMRLTGADAVHFQGLAFRTTFALIPSLTSNATKVNIDAGSFSLDFSSAAKHTWSGTAYTLADAVNIITNATTGTKICTATSQKLAFWNATPVVQQAHIADPSGGAVVDAEARTAINSILAWQATLGLTAAA